MGKLQQHGRPDLNVPLLIDENQSNLQGLEAPANHVDAHTKGSTSFFKTCFNGFNALSGTLSILNSLQLYGISH